jgi:type IV secretion system protein VirB6
MWGAKIVNNLLGNSTEGLSSVAMQQGGMGLLLTALIVSVPPMAAMFFQGTLGNFMSYSVFNGGNNSVGPNGQPPGAWSAHRLAVEKPQGAPPPVQNDSQSRFASYVSAGAGQSSPRDEIKSPVQHVRG